jgi:hypothetical protein
MMPPYCPGEAPPGERALFDALANSPETDRWIVLHSLAIASHVRQVKGEADSSSSSQTMVCWSSR